ncbi:hypothetical protein [Microvirga pudoricolor]|uniref:hypothetical protein n=1 Tax=Microvirga pudoricolor TaxID=2778729 RepID=UPI001950DECD|nr:hypothetical protein [Microvirga pudoricolor]MBM6595937.1 hypothetical protein [Microvirga pudoricolor]
MPVTASRWLYLGVMLIAGLVIGLIVAPRPHLRDAFIMPALWPLGVSFILEMILGFAVAQGKAQPLTMNDRFIGVIGAGLIVVALMYAMA